MQRDNRNDVIVHIIKVLVIHGADREDPVDAFIILEGGKMLFACGNGATCMCVSYGTGLRPHNHIPNNTTTLLRYFRNFCLN